MPPISSTAVGVIVSEIIELVAASTEPPATMIRCAADWRREKAASTFAAGAATL
jgi:hypothetical protein